jgi:hypothetical protein
LLEIDRGHTFWFDVATYEHPGTNRTHRFSPIDWAVRPWLVSTTGEIRKYVGSEAILSDGRLFPLFDFRSLKLDHGRSAGSS